MSSMVNIEIPWINIMSKMDLVTSRKPSGEDDDNERGVRRVAVNGRMGRRNVAK
jgi:hypothetical protein